VAHLFLTMRKEKRIGIFDLDQLIFLVVDKCVLVSVFLGFFFFGFWHHWSLNTGLCASGT
jgi:hypothetical protein